jgi:MoaA/NifB/PqqE/SkfB family radical SAM enzyme
MPALTACVKTGQVYLLPTEFLYSSPDHDQRAGISAAVEVLDSEEIRYISPEQLSHFKVPDESLGMLLTTFDISGLRRPLNQAVTPDMEIRLFGNLNKPSWGSILLGGACNSRCSFCYTEWIRPLSFTLKQAVRLIDRIAAFETVRTLVLTGGEATIRDDLPSLIQYARNKGFNEIALQTNGRALKNPTYVKHLEVSGLNSLLISLHGPNGSVHDSITGVQGSFEETIEALRNLRSSRILVTVNIVVCRANLETLAAIAKVVAEATIGGCVRFSYPIIEGAAFDNLDSILISFSELAPILAKAINKAKLFGLAVQIANMPTCVSNYGQENVYSVESLRSLIQASPFYTSNALRGERSLKLHSCESCAENSSCPGIQIEYLKKYPESHFHFRPVVRSEH